MQYSIADRVSQEEAPLKCAGLKNTSSEKKRKKKHFAIAFFPFLGIIVFVEICKKSKKEECQFTVQGIVAASLFSGILYVLLFV